MILKKYIKGINVEVKREKKKMKNVQPFNLIYFPSAQ